MNSQDVAKTGSNITSPRKELPVDTEGLRLVHGGEPTILPDRQLRSRSRFDCQEEGTIERNEELVVRYSRGTVPSICRTLSLEKCK